MKRIGVAVSVMFATGGLAAAAPPAPETQPAPTEAAHAEGAYGGVNPAAPALPDGSEGKSAKAKPAPKQTLTWIGFAPASDGSSELFFQSTSPFSVQQRIEGDVLVVFLNGLRRQASNTQRPLDTRFFATAIARVTARPTRAMRARKGQPARPAGIEVRIEFRDARDLKEATTRSDTGKDGMSYLYLGFGPGSAPAAAPPTPTPAAEPE